MMPKYVPADEDILWAHNVLKSVRDTGTLCFPGSKLAYRVFHGQKCLILTNEDQLLAFDSYITHVQTIWVFEAVGYTVLPDVRDPARWQMGLHNLARCMN